MTDRLSDRIRPNVEAAPWVVEEVKRLEQRLDAAYAKGRESMREEMNKLKEDGDGLPVGYADWYNRKFKGQPVDTARDHACEDAWRSALSRHADQ